MQYLKDNNTKYVRYSPEGKPRGTLERYITFPEVTNIDVIIPIEANKLYLNYFYTRSTTMRELIISLHDDVSLPIGNVNINIGILKGDFNPEELIASQSITLNQSERNGIKTIPFNDAELISGSYLTAFVCDQNCNMRALTAANSSGLVNTYGADLNLSAIETGIKAAFPYSELPTNIAAAELTYEFCTASPLIFRRA
jgi:hypothetical protein